MALAPFSSTETKADLAQSAFRRAGFQAEHVGNDDTEHHPYLDGERIAASQELGGQEMTDNIDTSREVVEQHAKIVLGLEEQLNDGGYLYAERSVSGFSTLVKIVRALLDERDAAIARTEKAEAALEAARIEGCRMGLTAVLREAKNNWEFVGEDFARGVAWVIGELDPTRIVKEHGK